MESRDIPHYNSPTKNYNTPVSHTSNLSAKASVNPNNQLLHFDPFKPAEYVLNNLGPVPGEEKIYAKIFKKNIQNVQNISSDKRNINTSRPTSVVQQQSMEIEETNLSVMEIDHTPVTEPQTDGVHSSSLSNSKSVEDDLVIVISDDENDKPIDGKDDDKPIDGKDDDKSIDGKDNDKPKDGKDDDKPKDGKDDDKPKDGKDDDRPKDGKDDDYIVDRDKLLRLYSHKLHIRKPRIPYSRISFDDSGILSDSDEYD
ncbi:4164_t:CDS:2 [Dentiscutata heterogama]|uniref:4164_t:CDS:1 n=1 Tax=Dentiscutata heterogama TaxID=1316150 RepID=A0ACA9MMN4_9GLOM|nr:4164_t:CDS:2 [Dentiscutata heterogama]